ncbi:MAG TPA: DUF924 family protein [Burkholderiaceae bacterium]|nr:DUF924 family protein [Burkholderiaceae bacterium]
MVEATAVLEFWFGAPTSSDYGKSRTFWFTKSNETDARIREQFGAAVEAALSGALTEWEATPRSTLALIVLLDQFTRNIFRDTPRAFAGDERALALARGLVESGGHLQLAPIERWFVYMPFEHSEALDDQRTALRLFRGLESDGITDLAMWAQKHHDVVARFGRFPHRNAILGRSSTAEEVAFLKEPGSRF